MPQLISLHPQRLARRPYRVCLTACFSILIGCGGPQGPRKYPVVGSVEINGVPEPRVAITFHHRDPTVEGNLRFPTGITDLDGRFTLSSEGDADGAVAGKYRVTFSWMSSSELDAYDLLGGSLSDPAKSEFEVEVPVPGDALPPFALTIPDEQIRSRAR